MTPRAETAAGPPARGDAAARGFVWLQRLLLLPSLAFGLVYIGIAVGRATYPYPLEWLEGSMAETVALLVAGRWPYVAPSLVQTPPFYPLLYSLVGAVPALVVGPLLALRLLSFASSLGVLVFVGLLVHRETGSRRAAIVAAGLYAATFGVSGGWMDLGRLDSFFLLIFLAAAWCVRSMGSRRRALVAGTLLALAFLAKQTALPMALPLCVAAVLLDRRLGLIVGVVFAGLSAASAALLDLVSSGWYSFYVFDLLRGLASKTPADVLRQLGRHMLLPVAIAAAVAGIVLIWRCVWRPSASRVFLPLLLASLAAGTLLPLFNRGAYFNTFMPALAGICIGAGTALGSIRRPWLGCALCAALAVQFAMLRYDPGAHHPRPGDRERAAAFVELLASFDGPVLVPSHPYFVALSGKPSHAHLLHLQDVLRHGEFREVLQRDIDRAIAQQRFAAIVTDFDPAGRPPLGEIPKFYRLARELGDDFDFLPVTGVRTRPRLLWVPIRDDG